jgi:hypothetical protein
MTGRRLQPTKENIMARFDMTQDPLNNSSLAATPEKPVAERDCDIELLYLIGLARRRSSVFSNTAKNPAVLRMAGWE